MLHNVSHTSSDGRETSTWMLRCDDSGNRMYSASLVLHILVLLLTPVSLKPCDLRSQVIESVEPFNEAVAKVKQEHHYSPVSPSLATQPHNQNPSPPGPSRALRCC